MGQKMEEDEEEDEQEEQEVRYKIEKAELL